MKLTISILVIALAVVGAALVGDALAQPDPSPAATGDSGGGSAASDGATPDKPEPDEPKADAEGEPSKPAAATEAKEEAGGAAEAKAGEEAPGTVDQAKGLLSSVKGGKWALAFGFFAMLLGSILRYVMKLRWEFWDTKTGGYVVAGITGLAALGTGIVSSGAFSMDGLTAAVLVMLTAMGLHGPAKAVKEKLKGSPAE